MQFFFDFPFLFSESVAYCPFVSKAAERRRLNEEEMENTVMENETVPPLQRRLDARGRVLRRERIFARLREGWTYGKIARGEGLTGERIGQIVREAVGDQPRREPHRLLEAGQPRPRPTRLLVEEALLKQVEAIAPLLDILDQFDRRRGAAKPVSREEARKTLLDKLDRAAGNLRAEGERKAPCADGAGQDSVERGRRRETKEKMTLGVAASP
jgi:hypothetical protein